MGLPQSPLYDICRGRLHELPLARQPPRVLLLGSLFKRSGSFPFIASSVADTGLPEACYEVSQVDAMQGQPTAPKPACHSLEVILDPCKPLVAHVLASVSFRLRFLWGFASAGN